MNEFFKMIFMLFFMIVVGMGLVWVFTANDVAVTKHFAPKMEEVRRETFEQTKSYIDGMIQEIDNFQIQYVQASPEHKEALKYIILHRVANFDENKLPSHLKVFINSLRQ